MFHIIQKSQSFNHQLHCGHQGNSERENVSEELFGYFFWVLYFYFCNCWSCTEIWFLLSRRIKLHHRLFILIGIALFMESQSKRPLWILKASYHAYVAKVVVVPIEWQTKKVFFPNNSHLPLSSSLDNLALTKKFLTPFPFENSTIGTSRNAFYVLM